MFFLFFYQTILLPISVIYLDNIFVLFFSAEFQLLPQGPFPSFLSVPIWVQAFSQGRSEFAMIRQHLNIFIYLHSVFGLFINSVLHGLYGVKSPLPS